MTGWQKYRTNWFNEGLFSDLFLLSPPHSLFSAQDITPSHLICHDPLHTGFLKNNGQSM